jgi:salicylate hydroxylase
MSMLTGMRCVVVGAGIGGLTVARALALRGARVSVLEQAGAIEEVGAGLQISPNGLAVLRALELDRALEDGGAVQAKAVRLIDYRGAPVARLDLSRLEGQRYFFVHRADLIAVLEAGARAAGVSIELGAKVARIEDAPEDGGDGPVVHLEDGGERRGDLVIGADGLHSVVRKLLNGPAAPFFTGQVAWRALIPNVSGIGPEARVHMGPGRHLVSYPLRGGQLVNLVAVEERRGWVEESWNRRDDPANLGAAFADFGAEVQDMLARVEETWLWGLFRHPVAPHWHGRAVAILGDAAHPTLPFMAQGAVMAIEDAWVLAHALARATDLGGGLADYQARRQARVERVVNTATDNAWKYHLKFPPLRFAAHGVMRAGSRFFPGKMLGQFDWLYGADVTRGD